MFGSYSLSATPFGESPLGPTVAVTGVSAKGAVPLAIEEHGGAFAENSFAEAPFASEKSEPFFITVNTVANVAVTGLEATAQSNGVVFNETINLTGLEATASVGSATVSLPTSISVTGLEATMPVIAIDSGGSLFGGISFGEEPFAELEDTGLKVIIQTGTGVSVTGVEGTGEVGSVAIDAAANVPVTGVSATGEVDSVSVIGEANVSPTGLAATGTPGAVTVIEGTGVNVAITSPRLQGQVGIVAPNAQIKVFVTGVAGTGETSGASVVSWNEIIVNQDPNWVEIAA
jgi:hypothetical protein